MTFLANLAIPGITMFTAADATAGVTLASTAAVTFMGSLSIVPVSITATASSQWSQQFVANGGLAPYTYSTLIGSGSFVASFGLYSPPNTAGTTVVQVTDALGQPATATAVNRNGGDARATTSL